MQATTFLTFVGDQCGRAEEAIKFYTSIFTNSEIKRITKYHFEHKEWREKYYEEY